MRELPAIPRRRRGSDRVGRYVLALVTLILLANVLVGEAGFIALFRASAERARLGLIRFRGHFPKGGYDVHDGHTNQEPATPPAV